MLEPTKKVMNEYCILVAKMNLDFVNNDFAKVNFELLCDIEVLYGLIVLLPLLNEVNNLMKLPQTWDVFAIKLGRQICFHILWTLTLFSSSMCFKPSSFWWIPWMTFSSCGGYWTWMHVLNIYLWLQWAHLGKTSWPTNKGCEFCNQRCAHSSCANCEKLGEKSCWILELRVVVSLSFTWCYGNFGGGFPSIPNDGKLWWIIQKTHCNDQGPILLLQKDWA